MAKQYNCLLKSSTPFFKYTPPTPSCLPGFVDDRLTDWLVARFSSSQRHTSGHPRKSTYSKKKKTFFFLTCKPGAPGSTPVSKIAMVTPLPSYSGYLERNAVAPVSFFGSKPDAGKPVSTRETIFLPPYGLSPTKTSQYTRNYQSPFCRWVKGMCLN